MPLFTMLIGVDNQVLTYFQVSHISIHTIKSATRIRSIKAKAVKMHLQRYNFMQEAHIQYMDSGIKDKDTNMYTQLV